MPANEKENPTDTKTDTGAGTSADVVSTDSFWNAGEEAFPTPGNCAHGSYAQR